jgi:sugar lactone lactonase YvrE
MSRKRIRQLVAIAVLVLLLALLAAAYVNYRSTRRIGIDVTLNQSELLPAPQYLYSFSGEGDFRLQRPLGVLVSNGRVFVTDSRRGVVDVFTPAGRHLATWGKGNLMTPLYVAENPKTGEIWVTDRRLRQIAIFSKDGKFLRYFNPNLPKEQLPAFKTGGVQWAPIALAFAPDGTLYVTEILNGHRLLIFSPDGTFKASVGTAGLVNDAKLGPEVFQFPNSVKVIGNEVVVADSNNRRLQVFDLAGKYKRIVVTQGLPRGFDQLTKLSPKDPTRVVVVDTLSHQATIWDLRKGTSILTFGSHGVLEGQFSYPNDVSVDGKRLIFIADTDNGRIQVWGWPAVANPIPTPTTPLGWLLCLSPLLLLPLLLLLRRRRFFATADFVTAMYEAEELPRMKQSRVRWEVTPEDYEVLRGITQGEVALEELLNPVEHSQADAQALQERYELDEKSAIVMSIAQRSKLFCTESMDLRRVARVMEIPVVDHAEFIAKYQRRDEDAGQGPLGGVDSPLTPDNKEADES